MRAAFIAVCVFAAIALALIMLVNFGATVRRWVAAPASYVVIDDWTIDVVIGNGIGIDCRVASVTETSTDVRVQSECNEPWFGSGSAALQLTTIREVLASPLGDRTVIDGQGHPATKCGTGIGCP